MASYHRSRFHVPQAQPTEVLFRDYEFCEAPFASGHYGAVWRCRERASGREFACKRMDRVKHAMAAARETQAMARAQGHPHVVGLQGYYQDDESLYVVMELCTRTDLLTRVSERDGLDEDEARRIFRQLASAVKHCHDRRVIHRDIKPENVFLTAEENLEGCSNPAACSPESLLAKQAQAKALPSSERDSVRLGDFGLALVLRPGQTAYGVAGSPPYEAPEVVNHERYGFAADVWSMGVVLYSMLAASWPSFLKGRVFNERLDFSPPVWKTVSKQAKDLIRRMLSDDQNLRPTAAQILRDPWLSRRPSPTTADPATSTYNSSSNCNPSVHPLPLLLPVDGVTTPQSPSAASHLPSVSSRVAGLRLAEREPLGDSRPAASSGDPPESPRAHVLSPAADSSSAVAPSRTPSDCSLSVGLSYSISSSSSGGAEEYLAMMGSRSTSPVGEGAPGKRGFRSDGPKPSEEIAVVSSA